MKGNFILACLLGILPLSAFAGQDIEVVDFEGLEKWLHKETDSIYVINFWATWCAPCVKELPYFEDLHREYATSKVKVLLVSMDFPNQVSKRLIPFLEKNDIQSHVILLDAPDPNSWIDRVSPQWSGTIPATVITYPRENYYELFEKEFHAGALENIVKPFIQ